MITRTGSNCSSDRAIRPASLAPDSNVPFSMTTVAATVSAPDDVVTHLTRKRRNHALDRMLQLAVQEKRGVAPRRIFPLDVAQFAMQARHNIGADQKRGAAYEIEAAMVGFYAEPRHETVDLDLVSVHGMRPPGGCSDDSG